MLFNSYIFILLFLPLTLIGYYMINRYGKYYLANIWVIGMSLWFYGYFDFFNLLLICGSILGNYILSRCIIYIQQENGRKILLLSGILINLGILFYYKYFDFFIINLNAVMRETFEVQNIVLPLGISFFTFQQISYLVDTFRGETKEYHLVEYALFVSFFPQLVAGPIVLHNEIIPQFQDNKKRKPNAENIAKGIYIFSIGLFKKVLIADTLGKAVTWGYGTAADLTSMEAFLVSIFYTFQLYFDFSGYCDMAIGISSMFNIQMPYNFNSPYQATSIIDFWNRWHMSLTRFLREYVYFPLGGSKKGKARTYVNIMIVFLISGIWHGANWTFILWGGLHGLANCLNRICKKAWGKLGVITQWFLTFIFVDFAWIIFRAENIGQAAGIIKRVLSFQSFVVREELVECFNLPEFVYLREHIPLVKWGCEQIWGVPMWLFLMGSFMITLNMKNSSQISFRPTAMRALVTIFMLVWSVMSFSGVSTFLYFNF